MKRHVERVGRLGKAISMHATALKVGTIQTHSAIGSLASDDFGNAEGPQPSTIGSPGKVNRSGLLGNLSQ